MKYISLMVFVFFMVGCDQAPDRFSYVETYFKELREDSLLGPQVKRLTLGDFNQASGQIALEEYCFETVLIEVPFLSDLAVNKSEFYPLLFKALTQRVPNKALCFTDFKQRSLHAMANGQAWEEIRVQKMKDVVHLYSASCKKNCDVIEVSIPVLRQGNIGLDMKVEHISNEGKRTLFTSGSFKVIDGHKIAFSSFHDEDNLLNGLVEL